MLGNEERVYSALRVLCAIWLHSGRLERKISHGSVLFVCVCVCVCRSECPVHLGNTLLPTPMLVQQHLPKVKAMGNVFSGVISFETEYTSFMT